MRPISVLLIVFGSLLTSQATLGATTDDVKWINRCVSDNKDEGATQAVILKYCTCMNNKMSDNETLSITAWERSHPTEKAACSREAGWK